MPQRDFAVCLLLLQKEEQLLGTDNISSIYTVHPRRAKHDATMQMHKHLLIIVMFASAGTYDVQVHGAFAELPMDTNN
jgi:hypothetical protein